MTKPSGSTSNQQRGLQRKPEHANITTPLTSIPLVGPSLEKLKLRALLNPCLTSEEAALEARIQECQASNTKLAPQHISKPTSENIQIGHNKSEK